jgi:hypothetical protein
MSDPAPVDPDGKVAHPMQSKRPLPCHPEPALPGEGSALLFVLVPLDRTVRNVRFRYIFRRVGKRKRTFEVLAMQRV